MWSPIRFATYRDPCTGMFYISWGRTTLSARTALDKFIYQEPEIR